MTFLTAGDHIQMTCCFPQCFKVSIKWPAAFICSSSSIQHTGGPWKTNQDCLAGEVPVWPEVRDIPYCTKCSLVNFTLLLHLRKLAGYYLSYI